MEYDEQYPFSNEEPVASQHVRRAFAMDRALRMRELFKINHYKKIMDSVYKYYKEQHDGTIEKTAEANFKQYCREAGLDNGANIENGEIDWLWNYLKNYDPNKWPYSTNPGW